MSSQSSAEERALPELSIIIPTFNEIGNISEVIRRISLVLAEGSWEIIVVDDDSPDGTAELVKRLARRDPRIRCLRRVNRRGLAGACIAGMLSSSAPYLAVMDADLQHDESILTEMLTILREGKTDLVVGSRHVDGGSYEGRLVQVSCSDQSLVDASCSFRAQNRSSGPDERFLCYPPRPFRCDSPPSIASGFKILADIIASTPVALRISEIGYTFRKRMTGDLKLDARVALDFIALLVSKVAREFIPVHFVLFAAVGAVGVMIYLSILRSTMLAVPEIEFRGAQTFATFVAMTSNFFINNRITYREQKIEGHCDPARPLFVLRGMRFGGGRQCWGCVPGSSIVRTYGGWPG